MPQQLIETQYVDAAFGKDNYRFNINESINNVPVKPPYLNEGIKGFYTGTKDTGEGDYFWLQKRNGMTKLDTYEWFDDSSNPSTRSLDENNFSNYRKDTLTREFTDNIIVDGFRYYFAVSEDRSKMRVYKGVRSRHARCENVIYSEPEEDLIINISGEQTIIDTVDAVVGIQEYDFDECLFDRFVVHVGPKGNPNTQDYNSFSGGGSGNIGKTMDGRLVYSETEGSYFEYYNDFLNAQSGDYMYVQYGCGATGAVFIVGEIDNANKRVYITQSLSSYILGSCGTTQVMFFKQYNTVFSFMTKDGLRQRVYDNDKYMDTILLPTTKNKTITWVTNYGNRIVYIDKKNSTLNVSGEGFDKFNFSALDIVVLDNDISRAQEYLNYLILSGPNKMMWYFKDTNESQIGLLSEKFGHWGIHCADVDNNRFLFIRSDNDFYSLQFVGNYNRIYPVLDYSFLTNDINMDMGSVDKETTHISLNTDIGATYISITDGSDNTKLLINDRQYGIRHRRFISGCKIKRIKYNIFMGKGMFVNKGNTDNGNPITQVVQTVFGLQGQTSGKQVLYAKLPIGRDSIIEKDNTFLRIINQNSGRKEVINIKDFTRSEYGTLLSRDMNYDNGVEINTNKIIFGSEWWKEYERYSIYGSNITESLDEETNSFEIGNYAVLKIPLGIRSEVCSFELVTLGKNKVCFGGFFVGFVYTDIDHNRYENQIGLGALDFNSNLSPY